MLITLHQILRGLDEDYHPLRPDLSIAHILKSWPPYFEATRSGVKKFDLRKRKEGRHFDIGQYILMREYSPTGGYSGRWDVYFVTYILDPENARMLGHENFDGHILSLIHIFGN